MYLNLSPSLSVKVVAVKALDELNARHDLSGSLLAYDMSHILQMMQPYRFILVDVSFLRSSITLNICFLAKPPGLRQFILSIFLFPFANLYYYIKSNSSVHADLIVPF